MKNAKAFLVLASFPVFVLSLSLFVSCAEGSSGGLIIIPDELKKASVPNEKYNQVHAVFLYDVGVVHFDPIDIGNTYFPSYAFSQFSRIKLFTRESTEGYMYGNHDIYHYGDLYKIESTITKPDGTTTKLNKNDYVTTVVVKDVVPGVTPPIDYKKTTIVFPGLEPGDIISYRYTKRGRQLSWQFNKVGAPVQYSKFMVARPVQRSEIQPLIVDRHGLHPEKLVQKGMATGMQGYMSISRQATYDVWIAKDVPAISNEDAMPPVSELSSYIRVWQGNRKLDWNTLGTTYYKWFSHYGRPPAMIKDLAVKVTRGISEPREKARAIHNWVKDNLILLEFEDLTYVPRQVEISAIDIKKLLREKNSTAEQAANLMFLMMEAIGITPTLVLASSKFYPEAVEGLHDLYQFTTPLLALDDGTLIDTTNRFTPFGLYDWTFEGRKALWCKGSTVSFRDIPTRAPQENIRKLKVLGEIEPNGDIKVKLNIDLTGHMAVAHRRYYGPLRPKERDLRLRELVFYAADNAEIDRIKIINLDNLEKDLKIKATFHIPGYAEVLRDKLVMKLGAFIHHSGCPILARNTLREQQACAKPSSEKRENPVNFAFKRYEEMDIAIKIPLGFSLQALPKGFRTRQIEKGTAVGMQTSYGYENRQLRVLRKFVTNQLLLDKKGYEVFKPMIKRYQAQKDTLITLELPKMD